MSHPIHVRETCIGAGLCESSAPELFAIGDGMRAEPRVDEVDGELLDVARAAARACPMAAIEVDP
ncbi:ferredoxin [Saccharopolyspora sp. 5N708]|uniref:ferredoxin n=1 Tax=Saccharopolyspora sp. 5N708 TaxID=3457424 RepID=UPI003FD34BF0